LSRIAAGCKSPLVLGMALSVVALIQATHRASQGRNALLKWGPTIDRFGQDLPIYGVGAEGYPTLPLSLCLLSPFHSAGEFWGPLLWATFQICLAWWLVTRALSLVGARQPSIPDWGVWLVVLLSFRTLMSDIQHGNLNLAVGALVAAAAWSWSRKCEGAAGLWLGIGAVLKVTPALGLVFLLWRRSLRGTLGMALGVTVGLALPALWVGWESNLELDRAWWHQMVEPYLRGRELTLLQTEHINQSLLGVMARYLTDSVAIPARPPGVPADISIHILALAPGSFRRWHLAACALTVAFFLWCLRRREGVRDGRRVLGEFSMLALAMLFLSERSWKHHYVLLAFPIAFLVAQACAPRGSRRTRLIATVGIVASALLHGATGSAFLGGHGSNLAEAYGAYLVGAFVLYLAVGFGLRSMSPHETEAADRPLTDPP